MKEDVLKEFGLRIKALRTELGINQKEFAMAIEVSGSYISELESGKIGAGFDFLYKLSLQYNINPLYLLHGKGPAFLEDDSEWISTKFAVGCLKEEQIIELISQMDRSEVTKYAVLSFFKNYQIENAEILKKEQALRNEEKPG